MTNDQCQMTNGGVALRHYLLVAIKYNKLMNIILVLFLLFIFNLSVFAMAVTPGPGMVNIEYKDYKTIENEQLEKLTKEFASSQEVYKTIHSIPDGGFIIVHIEKRLSIDSANTKYFKFVIRKGDDTLQSIQGQSSVPTYQIIGDTTYWSNINVVSVEKPIDDYIEFYVIEQLWNKRHKYIIRNNKNDSGNVYSIEDVGVE